MCHYVESLCVGHVRVAFFKKRLIPTSTLPGRVAVVRASKRQGFNADSKHLCVVDEVDDFIHHWLSAEDLLPVDPGTK